MQRSTVITLNTRCFFKQSASVEQLTVTVQQVRSLNRSSVHWLLLLDKLEFFCFSWHFKNLVVPGNHKVCLTVVGAFFVDEESIFGSCQVWGLLECLGKLAFWQDLGIDLVLHSVFVLYCHLVNNLVEPSARSIHVNRFELEAHRKKHFSGLNNVFHLMVLHIAPKVFVEHLHYALRALFYFGVRVNENVLAEVETVF